MATIQQGFPQLSSPIADIRANGRVTQPWQQFFIALWNRTGAQQGSATFEAGDLKPIAGPTVPGGWLLCDGSEVSRTTYINLYNAIGTTWGSGDNVSTFNLPDFRTRSLIGTDSTFTLGSTGGSQTTTLGIGNLPAHTHPVVDPGHTHGVTDPGHNHTSVGSFANGTSGGDTVGTTAANTGTSITGVSINTATTGISVGSTGSGTAFSNMPPYASVQWIIKT